MSSSIINDILCVLNSSESIINKKISISKMFKSRRGSNRILLSIIDKLLSKHILPIHFDDTLNRGALPDISEDVYNKLETILSKSLFPYFNAVCGEFVWLHNHNYKLAEKAVLSYYTELNKPSYEDDFAYTKITLGICRIYSKCKIQSFDYFSFANEALKYVENNFDRSGFCILFILKALTTCNENLDLIEQIYNNAISYYENNTDFERAVAFLEGKEMICEKQRNKDEIKLIRIQIAKNYEKEADKFDWADPTKAFKIINLIHKSMNAWERTNDVQGKEERKRLAKRLIPVKSLSMQSLKYFKSDPIDISELVEQIKKLVDATSLEVLISRLCNVIALKGYDEIYQKIKSENLGFSAIFASTILDNDGKIKRIIPSAIDANEEETLSIVENKAAEDYTFESDNIIKYFIWFAKEKFEFNEDNLRFLVEDNAFIPPDRKNTFLKGLVAGFNLDLSTSMHLLMPQIEHCIRCLAQECGAVVYKTEKNGVESCLSLESILKSPEIVDCLDETFLFNLRLFYTSDFGFGMRNNICHSLCSDNELQSPSSLIVWWFTLKFCCMFSKNLNERLRTQRKEEKLDE